MTDPQPEPHELLDKARRTVNDIQTLSGTDGDPVDQQELETVLMYAEMAADKSYDEGAITADTRLGMLLSVTIIRRELEIRGE